MTHPLSSAWDQPGRDEILVDDKHAVMTAATLRHLHEYSRSMPSGVYEGKMWRSQSVKADVWLLCWYGPSKDPNKCSINCREVLLI